ncbi:glycosyltransferase family 2 protein [Ornithobacterium rhinotracheale]|uniref:glycosyltransferase family 2 protein n=1 Tax=Ornithobacterium rhinotracheale TaxID=28251 RepID=UPI003FD1B19A
MEKPYISILTPTYNRANLLARVFESLQSQTDKDFEWIIVDDGSTDNTKSTVEEFQKKSSFPIEYYLKKNGGKHTALNFGIQKAKGDFIIMLDSDDELPIDAVSIVLEKTKKLPKELGGIAGRKSFPSGKIVGTQDDFDEIISSSLDIRYKENVSGDLTEVFRTSVMREFPFPEFKGERFCPEALVWNRIAQKYNLLFFNKSIYIAEYQEGGLTNTIVKIRMSSPKSSMIHYSELASYNIPLKEKIKATINFWRFSFNDNDWSFKNKLSRVNLLYSLVGFPLGFAMYLNDRRKNK